MQSKYDAVVVGAGPAGSAAAKEIAASGKSVLLLEKHAKPGTPLCCAEAISKPSLEMYLKPEPEWIKTNIEKIKLVSPSGISAEINHPEAGYVLDRKIFDNALAMRAVESGAELVCEAIGLSLKKEGNRFRSIEILIKGGSRQGISADIFIAADGVESKIARLAGIDNLVDDTDVESLLQYRIDRIELDPERLEFYVGNEIAPNGYVWVFPKSAESANIGLGISASQEKGERTAVYLDDFMEKRFGSDVRIVEKHCGLVPRYQGNDKFRVGNLLIAGDAARAVDSLSGAGILNAVMSGMFAGRAAADFLNNGGMSFDDLDRLYPGSFLKEKEDELKMYLRFREVFNKLKDDEFDDIIEYIGVYFGDKPVTSLNAIKFITSMIAKRPKLLRLMKYLV